MIGDASWLQKQLGMPVLWFESIESTNLYCKERIKNGRGFEGVVIANEQTNGQGRVGKSFYSPKDSGLYLTFSFPARKINARQLTPSVALAVCNAVEDVYHVQCGLKWVNDVYKDRRKFCGVLCQRVDDFILIGIGINLEKPAVVPKDLQDRMGWITEHADQDSRLRLICRLYENILRYAVIDDSSLLTEYRSRCIHLNCEVQIDCDCANLKGKCIGIDDDFSLLVEINGETRSFSSGYMVLNI